MAEYIFPTVNAGVEMVNPSIVVNGIHNNMNGTCIVTVLISIAPAPQAKSAKFSISLPSFYTYVGNEPITSEVEAWALLEIAKFEVV